MNIEKNRLNKGLNQRHIFFIALGSAIGTGLFYGSAEAIKMAGPAVLLAYILAGMAVFIVMRALGEMVVQEPLSGSFGRYATKYLGPLAGFITGWTYVFEMALVCIADITVFAKYMDFWYPGVSPWMWSLGITFIICGFNLCSVRLFGELEFWLSLTKVVAIVMMIVAGIAIIVFGVGSHNAQPVGISNLWTNGGWMPNGVMGIVAALSVVVFAFGGIEIIGLTAKETQNPEKNIPRAINTVPARILLFYVMTLTVLMSIYPWNKIGLEGSPFVLMFESLGISSAAHILNVVVITACVSAINSDMFGAGRMMYGLAQEGQAPKSFVRLSSNGVPIIPIFYMFVVLVLGVVLNYYYHKTLFLMVASVATFATILVWLMILLSQMAMRRKCTPQQAQQLKYKVPFWPVAPILSIAFIVFVIAVMAFIPKMRFAFIIGFGWIAILIACYYLWAKKSMLNCEKVQD